MNNALQQCNSAIDGLTERITTEEAKLQDGRRELREKLNLDMERVQKQVKTEEANLRHVDSWQTPELCLFTFLQRLSGKYFQSYSTCESQARRV